MLPRFCSFAIAALGVGGCGAESIRHSGDDGSRGGSAGASGNGATSGTSGTDGEPIPCRIYASRVTLTRPEGEFTYECTFYRDTLGMSCNRDFENGFAYATAEQWATIEDAVTDNRPLGKYKAVSYSTAYADGPAAARIWGRPMFQYDGDVVGEPDAGIGGSCHVVDDNVRERAVEQRGYVDADSIRGQLVTLRQGIAQVLIAVA